MTPSRCDRLADWYGGVALFAALAAGGLVYAALAAPLWLCGRGDGPAIRDW